MSDSDDKTTLKDELVDPGFDEVEVLAQALLELSGFTVSDSLFAIDDLFSRLDDYDKKSLMFTPAKHKNSCGLHQARSCRRRSHEEVLSLLYQTSSLTIEFSTLGGHLCTPVQPVSSRSDSR